MELSTMLAIAIILIGLFASLYAIYQRVMADGKVTLSEVIEAVEDAVDEVEEAIEDIEEAKK